MNRSKYHPKALFIGIASASALLLADGAMAQSDVTNLGIEEVVVTAQKREEDVQAVPISISTLSTNDIERRGVQSTADLIGAIPNMGGFAPPGAKGSLAVTMRGVASGSPSNLSLDTAIGIYIDGVILGKQVGSALDVAELERIEVLRGPQGTLYGRNSTGGAVNFVTRKPSGEFSGKLTGTAGSEGLWGYKANIDTPAIGTEGEGLGTLAASFGVQGRQRDALYENRVEGVGDLDDTDRSAYRAALRWDATDAITVDYTFDHSELDEANNAQATVGLTPLAISPVPVSRTQALQGYVAAGNAGLAGLGPLAVAAGSGDPNFARWLNSAKSTLNAFQTQIGDGSRRSYGYSDSESNTDSETNGHNLTAAWQFDDLGMLGSVEFKSISGWRDVEMRNIGDLDGIDNTIALGGAGALNDSALGAMFPMFQGYGQVPAALRPAILPELQKGMAKLWSLIDQYGGGAFTQDASFDYEQFSQELQMVGSTERLEYAVGVYYFEDDGEFDNYRLAAQPVGGIVSTAYDNDTEASAFYTQVTWTPPVLDDRLALTLGYRRTEEEKGIDYLYLDDGASTGTGLFSGSPLNLRVNLNYTGELKPASTYGSSYDQKFSNDSGSATVAYQLTDDTNVFLRWATGYRSGGFNGEIFNNPYEEETIEQWEFGVKSDIVPGTLRVNASIFAFEYEDMQVSQIQVTPNGQVTSFIGNAGKSERWGGEVEAQWSPLDNLLVALSYTHMDGDFEEFPPLCGTGTGASTCIVTEDLAQRAQSPDDSASLVTDWVFAQTDWAEFMAHAEVFWQDETAASALWTANYGTAPNTLPYVYDDVILDDRVVVNARVGIENVELGSGTLRSALWVRNAFDEDYPTFGINFATLGPITEQYAEERTYGIDVTWEF